jgi:hypothetical protein
MNLFTVFIFFLPEMLVAIAVNSPVLMAMPIGKYRRRQDSQAI